MYRPTIRVRRILPETFSSDNYVLALEFSYDYELKERLKAIFARIRDQQPQGKRNVGGWLPDQRVWFCEERVFASVVTGLKLAGYQVRVDTTQQPETFGRRERV